MAKIPTGRGKHKEKEEERLEKMVRKALKKVLEEFWEERILVKHTKMVEACDIGPDGEVYYFFEPETIGYVMRKKGVDE